MKFILQCNVACCLYLGHCFPWVCVELTAAHTTPRCSETRSGILYVTISVVFKGVHYLHREPANGRIIAKMYVQGVIPSSVIGPLQLMPYLLGILLYFTMGRWIA